MNLPRRFPVCRALAATLLILAAPRTDAAVTVPVLDSRVWNFTITGGEPYVAVAWWSIQFGADRLDPGDWIGIYFYEGSPAGNLVWEYIRQNTWDFSLNGVLKDDLTIQGFFAGGTGTVVFELYAGTVDIRRVNVYTILGGLGYRANMAEPFSLVPEPGPAALVLLSVFGLSARRGRRGA